jgi:hypothetical protein
MEMNGIPLHSWILYIIEAMVTKGQFAGFFFTFIYNWVKKIIFTFYFVPFK